VNDDDDDERRRSLRSAIELSVEYKRLNAFFADYTKNISRGGTFIATDRPLDVGTEFLFALRIRDVTEPLRLRGRVKWIVPKDGATEEEPAGMGIEFLYEDDGEREATERRVEDLMVHALGESLTTKLLKK
jgi:type IV pilus assembly protein PilZ